MPLAPTTIAETARLRLRRLRDGDLPAFMAYRNDPEVARYQGWDGITEPQACRFIAQQRDVRLGEPGQGCQVAVALRDTDQLIGDCYFLVDDREPRQAEIGYSLARAHQGRGNAAEAVAALLTWLFQTFDLHRVVAVCDCRNVRSIALLERLGLRREGHFLQNTWFKGAWADEYSYAVLRDEWLGRTNATGAGVAQSQ